MPPRTTDRSRAAEPHSVTGMGWSSQTEQFRWANRQDSPICTATLVYIHTGPATSKQPNEPSDSRTPSCKPRQAKPTPGHRPPPTPLFTPSLIPSLCPRSVQVARRHCHHSLRPPLRPLLQPLPSCPRFGSPGHCDKQVRTAILTPARPLCKLVRILRLGVPFLGLLFLRRCQPCSDAQLLRALKTHICQLLRRFKQPPIVDVLKKKS